MKASAALAAAAGLAVSALAPSARGDGKGCMDAAQKGQELRDAGQLLRARELFRKCAETTCPAPVPTYCAQWLAELKPRIPSVVFRANDVGGRDLVDVTVRVDGAVVTERLEGKPIDLDPGSHVLRLEAPGFKPAEQNVVAALGERDRVIVVKLEPDAAEATPSPSPPAPGDLPKPAPPPRRIPTASWIAWGVGAAGLIGFGIFGAKANIDYGHLRSTCGGSCTPSDRDSVTTSIHVADVSLAIGLVGAAVGALFFVLQPAASAASAGGAGAL
jgi:hypothetical protein